VGICAKRAPFRSIGPLGSAMDKRSYEHSAAEESDPGCELNLLDI
jgi:hypothetical protein